MTDLIFPSEVGTETKKKEVGKNIRKKERVFEQYRRAFGSLNGFKSWSSGDQHRREEAGRR